MYRTVLGSNPISHTVIQYLMFIVHTVLKFYSVRHRIERQPRRGGRGPIFSQQQEEAICAMVVANNAIRLREIQTAVMEDHNVFANIESVSVSTIDRVLRRNEMRMKQLYKVPFERNSELKLYLVSVSCIHLLPYMY